MTEMKIGKIKSVRFGKGGYDDAMFGITVQLGSDKESWGTTDFWGWWSFPPSDGAKWTVADQKNYFGDLFFRIIELCDKAKVKDITQLKDVPVEVVFDDMRLKSWRVLDEVI